METLSYWSGTITKTHTHTTGIFKYLSTQRIGLLVYVMVFAVFRKESQYLVKS